MSDEDFDYNKNAYFNSKVQFLKTKMFDLLLMISFQ